MIRRRAKSLTLIEVLVTVVLVAMVGITIISGFIYGIYAQRIIHEQNGATRVAAGILDEQKRRLFTTLAPINLTQQEALDAGYVIYDNGTPGETDDDVAGTVALQFRDRGGNVVGTVGSPIPDDGSSITAEVTIRWRTAGRSSGRVRNVTLGTILSP